MSDICPLAVEIDGPVNLLSFDRPDSANAMSFALAEELLAAVRNAIAEEDCSVLVLAGNSKFFSAGGDVTEMVAPTSPVIS